MAKVTFNDIKVLAAEYEYLNDFRKENFTAYTYARRHGWLGELGLKKMKAENGVYTYEYCLELSSDCRTRTEFFNKNKSAYHVSLQNGWLDSFTWLKKPARRRPRGYWTIERTRHALSVSYGLMDLRNRFGGAETAARRYGIMHLLKR